MRSVKRLAVFALASLASCATAAPGETARVLLNTRYVTGGDGPLVESLVVFDDGTICLKTIGLSPRWNRLSPADRKRMATLTADAATVEAVAALPRASVCCDTAEVAIALASPAPGLELPPDSPRASLVSIASLPRAVVTLLEERDRIGRAYFGRRYLKVLPSVKISAKGQVVIPDQQRKIQELWRERP